MVRILVLHGFTQSATAFSKRLGALRKTCGKDCDFVFLDGPLILTPADTQQFFAEARDAGHQEPVDPSLAPRAWWRADANYTKYLHFDETLKSVGEYLTKQAEPFDGVFGFSQGACFAGLLTSLLERPEEAARRGLSNNGQPVHPPFKFCVMAAGFVPRDPSLSVLLTEVPHPTTGLPGLHTRTLHIGGMTDVVISPEAVAKAARFCVNARVARHMGGHHVPSKTPWRNFLKAYLSAKTDEEANAVPAPEEVPTDVAPPLHQASL
jgi:hypothetical protein